MDQRWVPEGWQDDRMIGPGAAAAASVAAACVADLLVGVATSPVWGVVLLLGLESVELDDTLLALALALEMPRRAAAQIAHYWIQRV